MCPQEEWAGQGDNINGHILCFHFLSFYGHVLNTLFGFFSLQVSLYFLPLYLSSFISAAFTAIK